MLPREAVEEEKEKEEKEEGSASNKALEVKGGSVRELSLSPFPRRGERRKKHEWERQKAHKNIPL